MRWGIRYQLLVPLAMLMAGLVGIGAWTAVSAANHARRRVAEQMQSVVVTLTQARFPLTEAVLAQVKGLSGAEYLLVEANGRTIGTIEVSDADLASVPRVSSIDPPIGSRAMIAGRPFLCRTIRLATPHPNAGATVHVFYPESLLRDEIAQAVRPSIILGISGFAVSLLITLGVARELIVRIQTLDRRTRLIAAGDFSPMPIPKRHDELRDLAQSINDMANQLARMKDTIERSERLRLLGQVSGGLAHQLRNEVTGAALAIQLHAQSCTVGDRDALDVALRQLGRLRADLQRFLDLGRPDPLPHERCSLRERIDEAVALLGPQCRHHQVSLRWSRPEFDAAVLGNPSQLGHLFVNLLTNAVEAAGPSGWVEIRLAVGEDDGSRRAIVEIVDSGPGPSDDIQSLLFEPFVTGKAGGIGLGLAVAKQVTASHGGTLNWSREGDTTCFRVTLPIAE
jgi:signal transduction histidine kinase